VGALLVEGASRARQAGEAGLHAAEAVIEKTADAIAGPVVPQDEQGSVDMQKQAASVPATEQPAPVSGAVTSGNEQAAAADAESERN
jgi:hypothetical protein